MKMFSSTLFSSKATALLIAIGSLVGTAEISAQTTLAANGLSGATTFGNASVNASGPSLYNFSGPVLNNITGQTFGNNFTITSTLAGTADNTFIYGGVVGGSVITAGTAVPVSYNFTLAKNATTPGNVNWYLRMSDINTNPSETVAASSLIYSGTLNSPSANFSGSGSSYTFSSGASVGDKYRVFLEFTYTGSLAPASVITGTMSQSAFGGPGITLGASAIPEPSTYAAIAGAAMLGLAVWRRRSRKGEKCQPC